MNKINQKLIMLMMVTLIMGCQNAGDNLQLPIRVCSQRNAAHTPAPDGFKFTPEQAIKEANKYYIENPFELIVYADTQYYYVDIASMGISSKRAKENGVKLNGQTGQVVRGEKRIIGK